MSQFTLVAKSSELSIRIDQRSWHVLDHPYFALSGNMLRKAFGMDFIKGLGKRPPDDKMKTISITEFRDYCKYAWEHFLLTYQDLLSYTYSYEFENDKGRKHGGGQSGFLVGGLNGMVSVTPAGYCTLTLMEIAPNGKGRVVEIIDMRHKKTIETDDCGYLKIHRRKMEIDWYREMPRILKFLDETDAEHLDIYWK